MFEEVFQKLQTHTESWFQQQDIVNDEWVYTISPKDLSPCLNNIKWNLGLEAKKYFKVDLKTSCLCTLP